MPIQSCECNTQQRLVAININIGAPFDFSRGGIDSYKMSYFYDSDRERSEADEYFEDSDESFSDGDPFEAKLNSYTKNRSLGENLCAIQNRIKSVVDDFDAEMTGDGLNDLRNQESVAGRTNICKLFRQQERRARELSKLQTDFGHGPESDFESSDDEWKVEEKKILLMMEAGNTLAEDGTRTIQDLIEGISNVQSGAASRLSNLIIEIDAMIRGIGEHHKKTLLLEKPQTDKAEFTQNAIGHVRELLSQAKAEKDQVHQMLEESRNELKNLRKDLLQERTKATMKAAMARPGPAIMKPKSDTIAMMGKLNKSAKEIDALREENAQLKLKCNSTSDYDQIKSALTMSEAGDAINVKTIENLKLEIVNAKHNEHELMNRIKVLDQSHAHTGEMVQTLRHQIELLLKKNSILNEELKQSKMKQKTELSSQLKESENRHDERVKLLENEVTEKVNEHAKTAAAAIALAARIESESKTSKDTNLELKKKIKSLQSKIGIIQETNHSGKHKRRSAIAQIKLHGLEQDSKKIDALEEELRQTQSTLGALQQAAVENKRTMDSTNEIRTQNLRLKSRLEEKELLLIATIQQLKSTTTSNEELQTALFDARSKAQHWMKLAENARFKNDSELLMQKIRDKESSQHVLSSTEGGTTNISESDRSKVEVRTKLGNYPADFQNSVKLISELREALEFERRGREQDAVEFSATLTDRVKESLSQSTHHKVDRSSSPFFSLKDDDLYIPRSPVPSLSVGESHDEPDDCYCSEAQKEEISNRPKDAESRVGFQEWSPPGSPNVKLRRSLASRTTSMSGLDEVSLDHDKRHQGRWIYCCQQDNSFRPFWTQEQREDGLYWNHGLPIPAPTLKSPKCRSPSNRVSRNDSSDSDSDKVIEDDNGVIILDKSFSGLRTFAPKRHIVPMRDIAVQCDYEEIRGGETMSALERRVVELQQIIFLMDSLVPQKQFYITKAGLGSTKNSKIRCYKKPNSRRPPLQACKDLLWLQCREINSQRTMRCIDTWAYFSRAYRWFRLRKKNMGLHDFLKVTKIMELKQQSCTSVFIKRREIFNKVRRRQWEQTLDAMVALSNYMNSNKEVHLSPRANAANGSLHLPFAEKERKHMEVCVSSEGIKAMVPFIPTNFFTLSLQQKVQILFEIATFSIIDQSETDTHTKELYHDTVSADDTVCKNSHIFRPLKSVKIQNTPYLARIECERERQRSRANVNFRRPSTSSIGVQNFKAPSMPKSHRPKTSFAQSRVSNRPKYALGLAPTATRLSTSGDDNDDNNDDDEELHVLVKIKKEE